MMHGIASLREMRVILDQDLAVLYGVSTKALVQAVKRNAARFPDDFMFQLSREEFDNLRSQTVTSSWGGRRYPPYAFTEQGVAMLSAVLQSPRAVAVSIEIVRVFVRLRKLLSTHDDLREFMADVADCIQTQDDSATTYSDDLLQCERGYGGRVAKKEFEFVFFPNETERWEFRLLADEIDEIGSGHREEVRVRISPRSGG
jgi:hypothetical protein